MLRKQTAFQVFIHGFSGGTPYTRLTAHDGEPETDQERKQDLRDFDRAGGDAANPNTAAMMAITKTLLHSS